ncbi:MAG: glycoside hydrolase family 172 protein [Bdellovibrionota bacterium]
MDFLYPPVEKRGRFVQLTSYDKGPVNFPLLPPLLREWSRKCVILRSGDEHIAADVSGAGLLTRLFVGFPDRWNPALYRQIALRIYWDDESEPAVEAPLGDFFGVHHCKYRQYHSRLFSVVSGGIAASIPMPFSKGFRLTFTQEGRLPVPLFFYGLGYYELEQEEVSLLRFHAQWRREAMTRLKEPFTFLETRGPGYYVGLHLSTQNRDHWLLSPPTQWMLPRGLGLGHLEGWEEIYVDGEEKSRHQGTGHEEYFNTGWYFADGAFTSPDWGCLHRSYLSGRTASYRYHWSDPIPFREKIRAVIHHGVLDNIPSDYSSTAYFYAEGPLSHSYRMPPVQERVVLPSFRSRRVGYGRR